MNTAKLTRQPDSKGEATDYAVLAIEHIGRAIEYTLRARLSESIAEQLMDIARRISDERDADLIIEDENPEDDA